MPHVHVRVSAADRTLEFQGREAFFERVVQPVLHRLAGAGGGEGARPVPARDGTAAGPSGASGATNGRHEIAFEPSSEHFGLFTRRLAEDLGSEAQRVAAFAFYLWNYEKRDTFGSDEVAGCYAADGRDPPADAEELLSELAGRRLLAPAGTGGAWRLTDKGRTLVRSHLLSA